MTILKKVTAIIISIFILTGAFVFPASASAVSTSKHSMLIYTSQNLTFTKNENDTFECVVTGNSKGYIKVDANNEGGFFWLLVRSKKATPASNKPVISVYKLGNGSKTLFKRFEITVSPLKKIKFSNQQLNKNVTKEIILKNPYEKGYKLKYSKKNVKFLKDILIENGKCHYKIKGIKKGSTTVNVYISGTKKQVGSFKITVGSFKAKIKSKAKKLTLKYNSHIKSLYLNDGSVNLGSLIKNFRADAEYTFKADNPKLTGSVGMKKTQLTPKAVEIYSKKTGKTKLTIYEKRAKSKKKIGTISLTIKQAKDSAVFRSNQEWDNNGIFYERFISPGEKFNLKAAVVNDYINFSVTGSHFDESEYKFTAVSNHPEIISVDKDGVCTCNALDNEGVNRISYTVTFADGSKISGSGSFDIWPEDEKPV